MVSIIYTIKVFIKQEAGVVSLKQSVLSSPIMKEEATENSVLIMKTQGSGSDSTR